MLPYHHHRPDAPLPERRSPLLRQKERPDVEEEKKPESGLKAMPPEVFFMTILRLLICLDHSIRLPDWNMLLLNQV